VAGHTAQARIKQAKRMLAMTNMNMAEIASQLNFATCQYFSFIFKKEMGMPPNEFRKLATKW
jgi:YesN/AraC family two-component response regulator